MTMTAERCRLVFRKVARDLKKLSLQPQAEVVHGFRAFTRRLQTLVEELIPEHTRKQKKLLKMLGSIRKQAGKVRDLDVQIAALRSLKIGLEPRRKTLLLQGLIELRVSHEKRLRKLLTKQVVRDVRRRLKKASKEVKLETARDPLATAREILSRVPPRSAPLTEDGLHRCRILVKRARYAAEFAPESPATIQLVTQLKRLQDILGNWHDWVTLTHTASERLGDVNESPLVAALRNLTAGKFRQAVAAIAASPALQTGSKTASLPAPRKPGAKLAAPPWRRDTAA
jgi:CHAD domain-containing protein